MNVWNIVKKMLPFLGTLPFLRMSDGSIRTSASSGKAEKALNAWLAEDVAVGEKQDARAARRLAAKVPAAVEQLPDDLEGDEGLAGAGGQRQQDAGLVNGDGGHHPIDSNVW